jgi:hypothetical protein
VSGDYGPSASRFEHRSLHLPRGIAEGAAAGRNSTASVDNFVGNRVRNARRARRCKPFNRLLKV